MNLKLKVIKILFEITRTAYNGAVTTDFFPIDAKNLTEVKKAVIKHYNLKFTNPRRSTLVLLGISIDLVKPE